MLDLLIVVAEPSLTFTVSPDGSLSTSVLPSTRVTVPIDTPPPAAPAEPGGAPDEPEPRPADELAALEAEVEPVARPAAGALDETLLFST